jgi:DNA-binding CsgD family transcriptional regulator
VNNNHQLAEAHLVIASIERSRGALGLAEAAAHDALAAAHSVFARDRVVDALELLARIATEQGQAEHAARLMGATEAARAASGYRRDLTGRGAGLTALQSAMGAAFDAAVREGRSMALEDAAAYARRGRGERNRPSTGWASLSPSEAEVVELIREGTSNAEIAARLYISPRTVQSHLTRIYAKLGVKGRTALAVLPRDNDRQND